MNPSGWTTVRVRSSAPRSRIIDTLFASGVEAVQELDDEVVTHVHGGALDALAARIRELDSAAVVQLTPTPPVDWSEAWRSRITAHRLGGLVVTPPWLAERYDHDERIIIEPGMAFGTGEHETTRGVLRLMQNVVRAGQTIADLGSGSGILAIGAAKLGAARVVAIEMDPEAIPNAELNVRRNGVQDRVFVVEGDAFLLAPLLGPVDVILANIISSVLIPLLPVMAAALQEGGHAILSGMLREEWPGVAMHARGAGWRVGQVDEEGAWCSAIVERP